MSAEEIKVCEWCGDEWVDDGEDSDDEEICEMCKENEGMRCGGCERMTNYVRGDGHICMDDGSCYCDDCFENHQKECDECNFDSSSDEESSSLGGSGQEESNDTNKQKECDGDSDRKCQLCSSLLKVFDSKWCNDCSNPKKRKREITQFFGPAQ